MKKYFGEALTKFGVYLLSSSTSEGYHILNKREADDLYTNYLSKFVEVQGLRIHYRDEGQGFPIIMLHGFSASLHIWDHWVYALSDRYRLIRLDLPGFGLSDIPPKHQIDTEPYLLYLKQFLDHLEIKECYIAGNSFGGWLTWELGARYPEVIKRIILLSPAGYFTDQTKPKTVEFAKKPAFKELLKTGIPRFVIKRLLANAYGDKTKISEHDINRYYGLINREGNLMSMVRFATQEVSATTKLIKKIKQPTLLMWGMEDRIIPVTDAYKFHKEIPNSRLMVYKGVGHMPQAEVPGKTLRDLDDFLNKGS